jgi:ring-1,2-phenylacetyl-CoA epoxidase subunit PaaD
MTQTLTPESQVWDALREVDDPEIPDLSVVDLGIIRSVRSDERGIEVEVMPTFTGCPALELIQDNIRERLAPLAAEVRVRVTFEETWTTDRISEAGRERLRSRGFAPPPREGMINLTPKVKCPYCGSHDTRMENPFGPTLCRSIHYCGGCRQPFEGFKPL